MSAVAITETKFKACHEAFVVKVSASYTFRWFVDCQFMRMMMVVLE